MLLSRETECRRSQQNLRAVMLVSAQALLLLMAAVGKAPLVASAISVSVIGIMTVPAPSWLVPERVGK